MLDHFRERQRMHPAPLGLLALAAVCEAVLAVTITASLWIHVMQWLIVTAILLAGVMIRELVIRVGSESIVFGFGPIRRTIRLTTIASVRVVDSASLRSGVGSPLSFGIHRTPDDMMVWIAKTGPAVQISILRSDLKEPRAYIISTSRPHDLASALQSGQTNRAIDAD